MFQLLCWTNQVGDVETCPSVAVVHIYCTFMCSHWRTVGAQDGLGRPREHARNYHRQERTVNVDGIADFLMNQNVQQLLTFSEK